MRWIPCPIFSKYFRPNVLYVCDEIKKKHSDLAASSHVIILSQSQIPA